MIYVVVVVLSKPFLSTMSITYHPDRRNDVLHNLSLLHICGQTIHKLETLGSVYVDNHKMCNAFKRFNSVYDILLESDDHTIHFHKNYYVLESLQRLFGPRMDHLQVVAVYSYRHHGALVTPEECHFPTLRWDDIHQRWNGVSIYLESLPQQWASPLASPVHVEEQEESESELEDAFASPVASRPEVPSAPIKPAQPAMNATPSARRCLSDRFTALLQGRTVSEDEEASESEESHEDCCTVLRSGMKYPRNLH